MMTLGAMTDEIVLALARKAKGNWLACFDTVITRSHIAFEGPGGILFYRARGYLFSLPDMRSPESWDHVVTYSMCTECSFSDDRRQRRVKQVHTVGVVLDWRRPRVGEERDGRCARVLVCVCMDSNSNEMMNTK